MADVHTQFPEEAGRDSLRSKCTVVDIRIQRESLVRAGVLVLAWAGLTGILIGAGFGVVHSSSINAFDHHVTSWIVAHRTPALNTAMKIVTWLGSWVALTVTGVLIVTLTVNRRLPLIAIFLGVTAWAGESGAVTLVKHVVNRERPPPDVRLVPAHGWSWPSGHTATAVLVFSSLAMVTVFLFPRPWIRIAAWSTATVAVALVGFSRMELGVHWTTDVVASAIFVPAWLVTLAVLYGPRLHARTAPPQEEPVVAVH